MTRQQVLPFVAPFAIFMLCLAVEGRFPEQHYVLYPVKILLVAAVIGLFWRRLPSLKPSLPLLSIFVGVVGVIVWVGLDPWLVRYNLPLLGRDPFALYPTPEAWALFAIRLAGMTLVVPVMEELFWRGFLMRWLIREDFTSVPLGTYRPMSFALTTAFFASVHGPEWPLAAIVGLIYGCWFVRNKSLGNIMVAHGTTNLLLGLYCLFSGDWHFLSIIAPGAGLRH